jgi:tetratricopeptide (TPR) repeat protein
MQQELKGQNFTVISVAMDTRGAEAARPWIELANPSYPCLIDEQHLVSDLYGMVNVPNAVWINEEGRIVRPAEAAGTSEAWRTMDRTSFSLDPESLQAIGGRRRAYVEAIKDWVAKGDSSVHALSSEEVRRRLGEPDEEAALARANFRMGIYLYRAGKPDESQHYFEEAKRLHPESWNFKRQAWNLEDPLKSGGPEFWAAVDALGSQKYYPEIEMANLPVDPVPARE